MLDKSGSKKIELARWQYSGTTHDTVMGIGVVNCLYYNPELDRYWVIDVRIYHSLIKMVKRNMNICKI